MKKLVNSALILAAIAPLATGCIFVSDDDDGSSGKATVNVTWNLLNDSDPSGVGTCPPGGKISIVALRDGDPTPFRDDGLLCSDGSATAKPYDPGTYTIEVDVFDANDNLIARSESTTEDLTAGENIDATFDIDVANSFFDLSWTFMNEAGTQTVSCDPAGGESVDVLGTIAGTTDGADTVFDDCSKGDGGSVTTAGFPVAGQTDYTISVSWLGPAPDPNHPNDRPAIATANPITKTFDYANQYIDLGNITLQENHFPPP